MQNHGPAHFQDSSYYCRLTRGFSCPSKTPSIGPAFCYPPLGNRRVPEHRASMSMRVGTKLSQLELRDWAGQPVRLGTLWEKQPAVLLFIRHFG